MNYTTLVAAKTTDGSIKNWVNNSTIPATTVLTEAQAFIYERLRVREMMEVDEFFTFGEDASSEALPSGFLDPIVFVPHTWGDELPYVNEAALLAPRDEDGVLFAGTPSRWTVIGDTAYVDVKCSEDFKGVLTYYARPAALSGANETNFLTIRYPTMLRRACLAKAYEHMKDNARAQAEILLAEQAIADAKMTNDMFRRGQRMSS